MQHRILVVDDEPHIREVICFALERAGMATITARNGSEALQTFRRGTIDLIILDIGMPEMDGLEVCRQVRKVSTVPILFLSARDDEIDRVLGLEIGADDYVTKPFSARELVARVHVILRRVHSATVGPMLLSHGKLTLDSERFLVLYGERPLALTSHEFAILKVLISRPDAVHSRTQLMEAAYAPGIYVSERTIDSHIRNIRKKFSAQVQVPIITTVHGVGFRLGDTS